MPPKQVVDLDLDAIAPPNRTLRLRGKVYELPGDIPIATIVRAMQLQTKMESADEAESLDAINDLLEIIYDLFRENDPGFEPVPLSLTQVMDILGLVLSGMNIDFDAAVKEAIAGAEGEDEQPKDEDGDHPPTSLAEAKGAAAPRSRSRKRSPVRS